MKIVHVAVLLSLALNLASASRRCGPVYNRRYGNMICPSTKSVCADVFRNTILSTNGTRCEKTRILHKCMCPGYQLCPTLNPGHKLYETSTFTRYICQPVCSFPWCDDFDGLHPMVTVQRGYREYMKIGCRCPYHHFPHRSQRTTRLNRTRWEYIPRSRNRFVYSYFVCNGKKGRMRDPCLPQEFRSWN